MFNDLRIKRCNVYSYLRSSTIVYGMMIGLDNPKILLIILVFTVF